MSRNSGEAGLEDYLQESTAWDRDRVASMRMAMRRAWQVAAVAGACALASALALILLLPLKQTEPFLIRVDNSTGVADLVPLYAGHLDAAQSVTRYFLTHYVQVCERFNLFTAESDYEECGAFHTARRNQAWAALWNRANPQSPLNRYRDGSDVSVQIESVSFLQRASGITDLAQVRYLKLTHPAGGQQSQVGHWIATVQYAYSPPSQNPALRRWNPLGFKIIDFVTEPEVIKDAPEELPGAAARVGRAAPGPGASVLRAAVVP